MFNMHTHDNYEIYCFLSGTAKYFVEGNIYKLKSGDILIIKKAEAHSLLINSETPYERIVINFTQEALLEENPAAAIAFLDNKPLGKKNYYSFVRFSDTRWRYYLEKICASTDTYEKRLYLTVLLRELNSQHCKITDTNTETDNISDIINYINHHLAEPLSLDTLCEYFYISKSQLNRKFKRVTGSTVWEYITAKRLLLAKELLRNGEHPTTVSVKSGFSDYCTFYRAYKARFSVSPKNDFISYTKKSVQYFK